MSERNIANIKQLLDTPELAELGPGPRAGVRPAAELNALLDSLLCDTKISDERRQIIRSVVLLWHDHLDASHTISQGIESSDGSFVHAIMHRREPDFWNSKYWWRRVGTHPAFAEIAVRVEKLFQQRGAGELAKKLLPGGSWDASAFVDVCEAGKETDLLRTIQEIEFEVLLEMFSASDASEG